MLQSILRVKDFINHLKQLGPQVIRSVRASRLAPLRFQKNHVKVQFQHENPRTRYQKQGSHSRQEILTPKRIQLIIRGSIHVGKKD